MSIWHAIFGWFGSGGATDMGSDSFSLSDCGCDINPVSGLPMIDGCGGVDVGGSPYGMDIHHDHSMATTWDDPFSSSSSWDTGVSTSIGSSWDD